MKLGLKHSMLDSLESLPAETNLPLAQTTSNLGGHPGYSSMQAPWSDYIPLDETLNVNDSTMPNTGGALAADAVIDDPALADLVAFLGHDSVGWDWNFRLVNPLIGTL